MYDIIKFYYQVTHTYTYEDVFKFLSAGYITQAEFDEITGE